MRDRGDQALQNWGPGRANIHTSIRGRTGNPVTSLGDSKSRDLTPSIPRSWPRGKVRYVSFQQRRVAAEGFEPPTKGL